MKLYSMAGTCALSVAIVLEWIGVRYELSVLKRGQTREPDYLAINPSGQVPALRLDDGQLLSEAAAILPFLAELHPALQLGGGDDALGRFRLAQAMSYLTSEVHVAFKPHFTPQRFLDDPDQFAALRSRAWVTLDPLLKLLDGELGARDFLLPDHRTVADAYLYVLLRWVDEGPNGILPYPALHRFRAELETDDGVQKALVAHGMRPLG